MPLNKIRVLIVDDQAIVLDILSKGLIRDPGIEVVGTATDGQLALNQIDRVKPDVIILDLEMPRMNGIQFLHKLIPVHPIPTIVLSALTEKDSKLTQEAFEAGAVDFLLKPTGGAAGLQTLLTQLWTKIRIANSQDVKFLQKYKQSATLPSSALDRTIKTKNIILGMGAFDCTNEPDKTLKIFALGSCVGVTLIGKDNHAIAMGHVVLPSSTADFDKAKKMPGYFADTCIKVMLEKMAELGCTQNNIIAKIAGGAKTKAEVADYFGIGQRNSVAVKATLLKLGIKIAAEELGGEISRTIFITVGQKNVSIQHPEKGTWEI